MDDSAATDDTDAGAFRKLYALAADPEARIAAGDWIDVVCSELMRAVTDPDQQLARLIEEATNWSAGEAGRFQAMSELTDGEGLPLLIRRAVLGCAPGGLAAGAWLQWLTSPGNADDPVTLQILALYAGDVGPGHPGRSRGSAYLNLLRGLRAAVNAVPLARLAADPRIDDTAFRVPALMLLMSRRPSEFRPEIVGADLCLRAVGLVPPLALVRPHVEADWAAIDHSGGREDGNSPLAQCRAVAEAVIGDEPQSAARVRAGFSWAFSGLRRHTEVLHDQLRASIDPGHAMAELLRLRAREGSVYHHDVVLEDKSLSEWLAGCRIDPLPFLAVLGRSRLIKPGHAAASHLVKGLVSERGPMFRVFSPDDLTVITRWINALPTLGGTPAVHVSARPDRLTALTGLRQAGAGTGRAPANLREAYHALMTRNVGNALDDWSMRYVRGWLGRARHRLNPSSGPLPERWGAEGLRPWLQHQHDRNGADFVQGAGAELPSREAVVDDIVQTAPLTLIDGSWLQGFTDYELASTDIGHSLFATYWDELGNGEPKLNHPLIYRELLAEMRVDLPPTASPEFARWPGFRDASFELPVYWLCIGRYPRTFLPEVLGLNLAMELSGVGGSYRRAGMALREYGFSTRFVDIHNTIDNVATGHSAWAADAIDVLLSGLPDSVGPGSRWEAWQRMRIGYRSLNPPGGLMARRAFRRGRRGTVTAGECLGV